MRAGHLTENQFCKILFDVGTTETVSYERESFDVVCAFELLEHIVPWEFDSVINSLIRFMKINGKMMITVPNRYPHRRYIEAGRSRWKAPDHKNFFSQLSLEFFLKKHFKEVKFLTVSGKSPSCGVHLFAECRKLVSPRE